MLYNSLHDLINGSISSRRYFLSLPVEIQMKLHEQNEYIHTLHQLHSAADSVMYFQKFE